MEAMTKQILTDTAVGTAVGGASGALIGAGIGIVGSGALAQGQTLAARYTTAKDHQAHLGGGLAYNILHKYKWLSGAAKLEDRYDAKNEAVARSEYASTAASYQGLTKYPLFDAWGGLCLGGSEIMDAGSNFASLMSFAAELVAVELILAAFVSMGVTLPAAAAIKETGTMIGLVSDGLGVEAEMAKMEYLSYRAAKAGPGESPEKNEIIAQMAETNTDILGTTVKSIIDVFSVIGIPKTLNFGKLKKSAAAIGQMPGWIRKAESFAARAVGPLLKFAGRIKPWVLTAKKLLMGAYTIKKWVARVLGAYGDAKKFLQNSGKLAKRVGHAAGLVYQGAKSLGSSVVASVKEHGSQALDFLKGKFSAVKSAGLDAKNYAVGKIHAAENWAGSKANDASQWMLKNREWLGETLHQASDVFGVLSAATGVVATGLALTGIGLPFAAGVGMASLAFGAAAAASRAWYSTMLAVGTIDGSVPVSDARGEMWGAVRDTALVGFGSYAGKARTLGDGALSMARGESAASTAKVTGTKVADEIVTRKTLGSLNKVMLTLKKFYNLPLGKVLKDAALAKRLKWLTIALRATDFVKSVIDLVTSPLAAVGKSIVSGAKFVGHQIGKAESWLGHRAEAGAALIGRKGRSFALAAVHAGRSAFHKIGRGGLNLLQNAGRGLKSAGHSVAGHLTHLKSQAMELAAKANKWARQGVHQGAAALLTGLASALRQSHALAASAGVLFGRSRGRFMGSVTSGFAAALGHNLLAARSVLGFLEEGGHPSQIGSAMHEVTHTLSAVTYGIAGALTSAFAEDLHHAGLPHLPTRLATPSFAGHSFSLGGGFPSFAFSVPQAHSAGGLHPESALKMFGSQERAAAPSVSHFVSGLRARASSAVSGTAHSLPSLLPAAHGLVSAAHAAPAQVGGLLHRFMPHVPTGRGIPPRQTAGLVRSAAHAAHALLSPGLRMLHARGLRRALPTIPALSAVRHLLPSHLAATLPTIAAHPLTRLHGAEHRAQRAAHQVADHLPKMPVALAHIGHGLSHFFQRSGRGDHPDIDPTALRADLKRQSGGFLPDGNVRAKLGGHLGFDPGGARLHTGPAAAQASRRLNAEAFTIGNDVFFGEGRFDPHTPKGLGLIAHELTHVGQQTGTTGSKARFFTEVGGDEMEREAQQTGERVLANAGSRAGLFVEDYVREYECEGGLTQADQQRLDRISVLALAEAARAFGARGGRSLNADALDVRVEIDLGEMSDGAAVRVWAEAIVSGLGGVSGHMPVEAHPSVVIQRFEGGEHKWLGDEGYAAAMRAYIDKQLHGVPKGRRKALRKKLEKRLAGPMHRMSDEKAISYGSGVGLGGDFYGTPEKLYNDTDGFVSNTNVSGIVDDFEDERDNARKGEIGEKYKDHNLDYIWKSEDFLDLAVANTPHFGGHNLETYVQYHQEALAIAAQAHAETDDEKQRKLWDRARFTNAFADHFLTDTFASGHMRVPRQEIIKYFLDRGKSAEASGLMSKILHDYDNKHGIAVANARGDSWTAFGDSYLFADLDPARAKAYQVTPGAAAPKGGARTGRDLAMEAVKDSVLDVMMAYGTGTPPAAFDALQIVPFIDRKRQSQRLEDAFGANLSSEDRKKLFENLPWAARKKSGAEQKDVDLLIEGLPKMMTDFRTHMREDFKKNARLGVVPGPLRRGVTGTDGVRSGVPSIANWEKVASIKVILDSYWISGRDVGEIKRLCDSVQTQGELDSIAKEIGPLLDQKMHSTGQRAEVRAALARKVPPPRASRIRHLRSAGTAGDAGGQEQAARAMENTVAHDTGGAADPSKAPEQANIFSGKKVGDAAWADPQQSMKLMLVAEGAQQGAAVSRTVEEGGKTITLITLRKSAYDAFSSIQQVYQTRGPGWIVRLGFAGQWAQGQVFASQRGAEEFAGEVSSLPEMMLRQLFAIPRTWWDGRENPTRFNRQLYVTVQRVSERTPIIRGIVGKQVDAKNKQVFRGGSYQELTAPATRPDQRDVVRSIPWQPSGILSTHRAILKRYSRLLNRSHPHEQNE